MGENNTNPAEQRAEQIEQNVPAAENPVVESGAAGAETSEAGAPSTPATPSAKDSFNQRFMEANSDLNADDEDAYYGRLGQYMDEHKTYGDALKNVREAVGSSEDMQDLLASLAEHNEQNPDEPWSLAHLLIMKVQNGEIDLDELQQNPDYAKVLSDAKTKKQEDAEQQRLLEEEGEKNFKDSIEMMQRIRDERGLSSEQVNAAMELAYTIHDELESNKLSEDTFNRILDSMNYKEDVETARQAGEASGIRKNIKERTRRMGDRMPERTGGVQTPMQEPEPEGQGSSMFGI